MSISEYSVQEVAEKRANDDIFILLDVREIHELNYANLGDFAMNVPLSVIAEQQLDALPDVIKNNKEAEVVVMCHHGGRSAQVAGWLHQQGWNQVYNMKGGIDAYAVEIDPSIGRY